MTGEPPEVTVTIEVGARSRRLPLLALAAALRLPREPLRRILAGLVLSNPPETATNGSPGKPTEGVPNDRSVGTFPPKQKGSRTIDRREGERGEGSVGLAPQADVIARVLDDEANLPAIRRVVEAAPGHVVQAALTETLAVPEGRIRRSRGAYFTAAVRRRQRPSSSTSPSDPPYA